VIWPSCIFQADYDEIKL